jgi:hypothetical protein
LFIDVSGKRGRSILGAKSFGSNILSINYAESIFCAAKAHLAKDKSKEIKILQRRSKKYDEAEEAKLKAKS